MADPDVDPEERRARLVKMQEENERMGRVVAAADPNADRNAPLGSDPSEQEARDQLFIEQENRVSRMRNRNNEIARLKRENALLYAEDGDMAASYINMNNQTIAKLEEQNRNEPEADLADVQDRRVAEEARRQAWREENKSRRGGKAPYKGSKASDDRPRGPESAREKAARQAREMQEQLSSSELSDEDMEPQAEEYPYDYDAEDRPSKGGKKPVHVLTTDELAEKYPSPDGKQTPEKSDSEDSAESEEEEEEEEEEQDEEDVSWEEDERRLKYRLVETQNALDDFAAMTNQTIRNAEASHGKAKRLVEMLDNGAAASDDVKALAREMLEASALTLVEAYSAEEAQERAADNLLRASDRLRQGTSPHERRADIFSEQVLRTQELIEKIKETNAM